MVSSRDCCGGALSSATEGPVKHFVSAVTGQSRFGWAGDRGVDHEYATLRFPSSCQTSARRCLGIAVISGLPATGGDNLSESDRFLRVMSTADAHHRPTTALPLKSTLGFAAFISYSQRNARIARKLHLALKRYKVPAGLEVPGLANDRTIGRVFRDDEDMGADPSLAQALDALIDSARTLVVVCTPDAARSPWVDKEVRRFKRRRDPRVFAVIAKGIPHAADPRQECFAPALKIKIGPDGVPTGEPDEPLAPNMRRERLSKVTARLVAGIVGVAFDDLWRHDRRRAHRRQSVIAGIAAAVLIGAALTLLEAFRVFDASGLVAASVQASAEGWRRGSDAEVFERAFRQAVAATPPSGAMMDTDARLSSCNLNAAITTATCALAFSGQALPQRRIFDERPTTPRGNFRDDIPEASGLERRALRLESYVRRVAFAPNGEHIALSHSKQRLVVYDVARGHLASTRSVPEMEQGPIAIDDTGRMVLVKGRGNNLLEVDLSSGAVRTIHADAAFVHQLARSGSQWLALVTGSAGTRLIVIEDGRIHRSLSLEEFTPYHGRSFSRSLERLVSYGNDSLYVIDLARSHSERLDIEGLGVGVGQVKSVAADDRLDWAAIGGNGSGGTDNAVQVISLVTRAITTRLVGHTGEVYAIAFAPDGATVATGGADMTVRLWKRSTGVEFLRLGGHMSDIMDLAFSPDGRSLVTTASDGIVTLWDLTVVVNDGSLREPICAAGHRKGTLPSTLVSPDERMALPYFAGRPQNVCDWRGPATPAGFLQSMRATLARTWFAR